MRINEFNFKTTSLREKPIKINMYDVRPEKHIQIMNLCCLEHRYKRNKINLDHDLEIVYQW